jgi:cytochrome c biogenesis protein CcdA
MVMQPLVADRCEGFCFENPGAIVKIGDGLLDRPFMLETLQTQLYLWNQWADQVVSSQLAHVTPVSVGVIFLAGLLTSLTPCMLSMLPITVGYMGAYDQPTRSRSVQLSLSFAAGLATTLAGLGIVAASLGKVYGQIGPESTGIAAIATAEFGQYRRYFAKFTGKPASLPNWHDLWVSGFSLQHTGFGHVARLVSESAGSAFRGCVFISLRGGSCAALSGCGHFHGQFETDSATAPMVKLDYPDQRRVAVELWRFFPRIAPVVLTLEAFHDC